MSSPRKGAMLSRSRPLTVRASRCSSFRRLDSMGSLSRIPAVRRTASAMMPKGVPGQSESAHPLTVSTGSRSWTFSRNSCRRRDFPVPAAPITRTALATGSLTQPVKTLSSVESSRVRPRKVLGLPRRRGLAPCWMRSGVRTRLPPDRTTWTRASSMPAETSSSLMAPGRVRWSMRTPRSMISPSTTRADTSPRPVATQMETSGRWARRVSAHCAARSARSTALPAPHWVTISDRPGSSVSCPPYRSSAASSSGVAWGLLMVVSASGSLAKTTVTRRFSLRVMEIGARSEAAARVVARMVRGADGGGPSSISPRAASSRSSAEPSAKRSAGALAIIRAMSRSSASGISGRTSRARGVSWRRILASTAITCAPSKAQRPVTHSNRTQPAENTSARGSPCPGLSSCSGAM